MKLILPNKKIMNNTGDDLEEDPLSFYYTPILSYVYRKRLKIALSFLTKKEKVLEVGYGSGIFFPTLNQFYKELHGLDIHKKNKEVTNSLEKMNIKAKLISANLLNMPYRDQTFDTLVSMSTFEHIKEIDQAIKESARVLKPNGEIIVGVPARNSLTNTFFDLVGEHEPVHIMHPTTQFDLLRTIKKYFKVIKIKKFPEFLPLSLCFYVCIKGIKK